MKSKSDAKRGARRQSRILFSTILAGPGENGGLTTLPSQLLGPIYVEDALIGPHQLPSSLLVSLMRIVLQGPGNDGYRAFLCQSLAENFYPRPVDRRRWPAVRRAAEERARERRTTVERQLVEATAAAIALIAPADVVSSPERTFEQAVRQRINELVTADLLGPDWRHCSGNRRAGEPRDSDRCDDAASTSPSPEDHVIESEHLREWVGRAKLSPREREVLSAVADGWTVEEWARSQGIKASGARTALMRARRKLKAAAAE